jgi:HTH-type transcriptional regulator/antitoxin HigA
MSYSAKHRDQMMIRPIHTRADHAAALARIEALWQARPGTPAHDELEVLGILVAAYEDRHWPILPPDPVDAAACSEETYHGTHHDPVRRIRRRGS